MSISKNNNQCSTAPYITENIMRGHTLSREYQKMEWVRDIDGKEYVCYSSNVKDKKNLSDEEKANCLDSSQVLGDSW